MQYAMHWRELKGGPVDGSVVMFYDTEPIPPRVAIHFEDADTKQGMIAEYCADGSRCMWFTRAWPDPMWAKAHDEQR